MIEPEPGVDFGAGPGQTVEAWVRGGPAGLVLDGRGAEIAWPDAELARRACVRGWLRTLDALPPEDRMRSLHFSLAPRPRVILRRWRLLPTDGEVLLEVGDRVLADTVVARARGQGAMVTVNVASALDLRPAEVAAAMVRQVGDPVAAGDVLARTRGLWGWLGSGLPLRRSPARSRRCRSTPGRC